MSDAAAAFAEALAAFQAELPAVKKGQTATVRSDKGNYSYDYADLTDISEAAMPVLARHGLSFNCYPTISDTGFILRYQLRHSAGHVEGGEYPLPDPSRSTPQQIGSWLTYGRRYCLCAATGIAPGGDDDDGQKAADARAAEPLPRAPRTRGATTRRTGGDPAADDPWTTDGQEPQRKTDLAWLDGFRARVTAAGSDRELQVLQGEANHVWGEGRLSPEDAQAVRQEVTARIHELQGTPT